MTRLTPPLHALHAFVTAASSPSFRAAADELALSPSALSRRITSLEAYLGLKLFDRTCARPKLTAAGQHYSQRIKPALDIIQRASLEFKQHSPANTINLQASQSLAINWLLAKLPDFHKQHDDIHLKLCINRDLSAIYTGQCELSITATPCELYGLPSEVLLNLDTAVMSSPDLIKTLPVPLQYSDIAQHTLFSPSYPPDIWAPWLRGSNIKKPPRCQIYDTITMCYEATAAGFGLGLGIPLHMDNYLLNKRLQAVIPETRPSNYAYTIVFASDALRRRPEVRRIADWLQTMAAQSAARFTQAVHSSSPPFTLCGKN